MSLEHVPKGKFNICMTCRNVVKKRIIGSKRWLVQCSNFANDKWSDSTREVFPEDEEKDTCPFYVERLVGSLFENE